MDCISDQTRGSERTAMDDAALMRGLAARRRPGGRARLGLSGREARRLSALLSAAERLRGGESAGDEALARLAGARAVIGALVRQTRADGGARLPAWGRSPRIEVALAKLCAGGEAVLTPSRLCDALEALDAAQALTMAELWAVPEALRAALCRALTGLAADAVRGGRAREAAARWVRRPVGAPRLDADFVEHALAIIGEEGLAGARERLEAALEGRGVTAASRVAQAQAARARALLRVENLLSAQRMLDALDWQSCFERLSRTERELRGDPAGVYGRMDDASRAAVREQVADIARRLRLPEVVVARHAADAAGDGGAGGVCRWLYDDAGRAALLRRLGRARVRLPRMTPDPRGLRTMAALAGLSALLTAALAGCAGRAWLMPLCLPLGWSGAAMLAGRVFPRLVRPARLLKLEFGKTPDDCRTLVVMPVLLSGAWRAREVCDQLEALGCLEADANIDYLLLGDFADAQTPQTPGDAAILEAARACVAALNARAEREKYALLVRQRTLLEADGVWMGRDRKRGALEDMNRVLLGEADAEAAFRAEGAACGRLRARRFAFVITLDADTRLLPGEARRLIGALAHPLNRPRGERGFAILQPRMELMPSARVNGFVRLFGGPGGVSTYPVSVSNLWQDATGRGIYAGKGVYDVAAFRRRLDGALPEGRVLSHDLIEGAIAGAGYLDDAALYDGHPASFVSWLRRLHRWTRGDWQLLPFLTSARPLPNGRRLSGADRFKLLDNLMRSLRAPALLGLLLCAVWTGGGGALLAALAAAYAEPLLALPRRDERLWRRATAELAALPSLAWCALDACGRTLWRLGVSGRHLLEWVTAADAEDAGAGHAVRVPGRAAAILLAPALFRPGWTPAALGLMALFTVAPGWIADMEADLTDAREPLTDRARALFAALARDTWRFFEAAVPGDAALPPDNVQLDPPTGAARRTSPTNIGLYLLGCLAARRLGFLELPEMRGRMARTLDALERMEKWRGHLYNWIDIDALAPLLPRYVSSVDSGNLAAALLACANAPESGGDLAARMRALAEGMDFAALYDGERALFAIGIDAETGRMSDARYDLLASEARILSYVAMQLGQVPTRHWSRLGRPCAAVAGGVAPLSWSGTLFEYLMPLLFMPAWPGTLLGDGVRAAVRAQMAQGRRTRRPWGVSESGCGALDAALNYQYRAFGLRALALSGEAREGVVAPYASALAAMVAPEAAAENLSRMLEMGWADGHGLYEAADYLHAGPGEGLALVASHMAHHQGMVLCALCNALTGDSLRDDFMRDPRARALSLLLEERPCAGRPARPAAPGSGVAPERPRQRLARTVDQGAAVPGTHLLYGDGATALCTSDGAVHYRRFGVDATRFSGDLQCRPDRACARLTVGEAEVVLGGAARFEPGIARFSARVDGVEAELAVGVSPEDGTLVRRVALRNAGTRPVRCAVADVVPVALAREADWRAHAAFQRLFVESCPLGEKGLLFRRRPGSRGADGPALAHRVAADGIVTRETDYDRLVGRTGDPGRADGVAGSFSGTVGGALDPVSALRVEWTIAPGATARAVFALSLLDGGTSPEVWLARWGDTGHAERALRLCAARARAALDTLGLDAGRQHVLQRLTALLADGRLAAQARPPRPGEPGARREALWPLGLSGDRPILLMTVSAASDGAAVRELIRAHGFYRAMGVEVDLALVDEAGDGYLRPARERLENLIDASHLNRLRGVPGGVWLLDGGALDAARRRALSRRASAAFDSDGDFYAQARALLAAAEGPRGAAPRLMPVGASTLPRQTRLRDNGYGGFLPEGGYALDVLPERLPPAPWCNILANDAGGILLSERGGGFIWRGNSRFGRLTPFGNDPLREGWGLMLYLADDARGELMPLLPGERPALPFRVTYDADSATYAFEARRLAGEARFAMAADRAEVVIDLALENRALRGERFRVIGFVDWLAGADERDAVALNCWHEAGACLATGACGGAAWFAASDAGALPGPGRCAFLGRGGLMSPEGFALPARGEGWTLGVPVRLRRGKRAGLRLAVGWAEDAEAALARVRALRSGEAFELAHEPAGPVIETPDGALNRFANDFLPHQLRASRVLGRTGPYQPGGAYGFRDQLQDMLALMRFEPGRARAHILRCAARQFEAGDVMHWWHEPYLGVRTRVSDDMLFLPWVAAAYVKYTGDAGVLDEPVAYLQDVAIPADREDVYCEMRPGEAVGSLHEHCMRAFCRAAGATGPHGLLRMGAGDWNDGMNRVGARGRGESVWLSQFAVACAARYRAVAPVEADRVWLWRLGEELRGAVEAHGWDGGWYLRAYADDGRALGGAGSPECRIDAISQAWAVLAGLDGARCRRAMDAAWAQLADEEKGIIRLLTPPFEGNGPDPGYIRGYPPGVRENGGQYTHGALWLLLALIRMGDGARAHRALRMLLPFNHSDSPEGARRYRVEPYVMAADVYDHPAMRGRGGWTWYTGAAGWMHTCILELLGFERRGDRVRLGALLGDWPRASVTLPFGGSRYRLTCDRKAVRVTLDGREVEDDSIVMVDDGRVHEAVFPPRITSA